MPKLPPYAKNIPNNQEYIIICTGSEAWSRAQSISWMNEVVKTLLPLGDAINAYRWDFVYCKEVILFSNGTLETYDRLTELSRSLLKHGALKVLWCIPKFKRLMKFISKEATA
ncbi:hypothetical protein [methanotrophic endosymbiont of Bathymodiolus puteoserpentis (Logatchev)]|jgi:hypothetical protein|uniref:hypothetical protein n=1 Tax=methanotrophic endosymbiont of Bathymodiolus puteoserpentis (Logatchev) TaxID=343235 RepID=UPI0013CCA6D4|nr:hypothetical protein [methanotrophic endosymbiont of Bathymodiolus puteoserpentis (Logatchev)]SHE19264.1 hypothetical protein BPUTEOMOX_188 [methanotrophic endosymbiont of Bathymodiolus puteoserpentis (Logatchev)]